MVQGIPWRRLKPRARGSVGSVFPKDGLGLIMERGFAVIGLGYVGLPGALALAKEFEPVIGFDISSRRIAELRDGEDNTGEVTEAELRQSRLRFTEDADMLNGMSFF